MHKNRRRRSVAIQSTDFFSPELEARAQPARLCKKAGFRNLLQKSMTYESHNNVEQEGSSSFLEGQRSKSVQATFDDAYSLQRSKFRSPSLETISIQKKYFYGKEDDSRRTSPEMVKLFESSGSEKPGTSRAASTVFSSITQMSDISLRPNEGSLAVVYNRGEKASESLKSSNLAFFFGSQGSRRFSDETVILIQDYQSYDLINAAGRREMELLRENMHACCGKSKHNSTESAKRPIPIGFHDIAENDEIVCRICHEGEEIEPLIQPCLCKGSVGYLHANCLKLWLEQSNTSRCELCSYPYAILQTKKYAKCYSVKVFFKTVVDRRAMAYDIISFVVITPLTLVGVVMCIQASLFSSINNPVSSGFQVGNITKAGLIMLSVTIIVAYAIWLYTLIAFHYKAWRKWYNNCFNVEVLPVKMTSEERLEAARRLSEEISRRQYSRERGSALVSYAHSSQNLNFNQGPMSVGHVS